MLIAQGVDIGSIADQVGHASVKLTQNVYRHVFDTVRVDAMRKLQLGLEAPVQEAP
jgi:integrase